LIFADGNDMHANESLTDTIQRPGLFLLGTEPFRAAAEFARQKFSRLNVAKVGDGHPVIIFPGLGADGRSVATLCAHCRTLGYDAVDWGQGFNTGPKGDFDDWLTVLKSQVADLLDGHTQQATLIGWSLGGLYAREIAKLMAPRIRHVITIGTPFNADADYTNVGWMFRLLSGSSPAIGSVLSQRLRTPPPMRTTAIYSRSDGVVAWQTCRHDQSSPLVQDIEVNSSHIGMGWNREVLDVVTQCLAQRMSPRLKLSSRNTTKSKTALI
jgi:pimeloyl-ACP methyl ester carboxylesterase